MRLRSGAAVGRRLGAALLVLTGAGLAGLPGGPAAAAADAMECSTVRSDTVSSDTTATSRPLADLDVARAQHLFEVDGQEPGAGVGVAVVDSGIAAGPMLPVQPQRFGARTPPEDFHGTAVAGLVAGRQRANGKPLGVAPGADLVDVRVYDSSDTQNGGGVRSEDVAAGLEWLVGKVDALHLGVVNLSLALPRDPDVQRAIDRLHAKRVVVVAASGNRPQQGELNYDRFGEQAPGEDAGGAIFPAAYDHVLAVNATAAGSTETDVRRVVLASSDVDVAAPTAGAVTVGLNGRTCVVSDVATSWAAAEVSGVVALLRARFPHDTVDQTVARLMATADGHLADPTLLEGAGVVRPVEALTRPLSPSGSGRLEVSRSRADRTPHADAVEPKADVLAGTREHALWWGLLGGGALLLALLLRPVLARRG